MKANRFARKMGDQGWRGLLGRSVLDWAECMAPKNPEPVKFVSYDETNCFNPDRDAKERREKMWEETKSDFNKMKSEFGF